MTTNKIGYLVFLCMFLVGIYLVSTVSPKLTIGLAFIVVGFSVSSAFAKGFVK